MSAPWPFYKWGVDILGPFPQARLQLKFSIVAVDYFSMWIEAEAVATIAAERVKGFYWKNIICRFGVPYAIVADNGTQFSNALIQDFAQDLGIQLQYSSVEHPQTNGQAESANKVILTGLKKRLKEAKGNWAEELQNVLWAYRTTIQSSTGETPFKLTCGSDAMLPIELDISTYRTIVAQEETNNLAIRAKLDLAEEDKERARIKNFAARQRAARKYNLKVIQRTMAAGHLVLRKRLRTGPDGKLAANWEGPYRLTAEIGKRAYKLEELDGRPIPRSRNVANLRLYFS